jgi:hypothetical protein
MADIPIEIQGFIDARLKDKDNAERYRNQRLSYLERAKSAYTKAKLLENTFKSDFDALKSTNEVVKNLDKAVYRAALLGKKTIENTEIAVDSLEKVIIEMSQVSQKAEDLIAEVKDYKDKAKAILGEKAALMAPIDAIAITTEPTLDLGLSALDKALSALKNTEMLFDAMQGTCGVESRLVNIMTLLEQWSLPLQKLEENTEDEPCQDCEDEEQKNRKALKIYVCAIPAPENAPADDICDCQYDAFIATLKTDDSCLVDTSAITKYCNDVDNNYNSAKKQAKAASVWLNCATEAKNNADAKYNACKGAYEASVAARKC